MGHIINQEEGITVSLLTDQDHASYRTFVDRCPVSLVQHSLNWRDFVLSFSEEEDACLIAKDAGEIVGVLPAFIFRCELGDIIESTPFAGTYGGILSHLTGRRRDALFRCMLSSLVRFAQEQGCVLVTITTPPFADDLGSYDAHFQADFSRECFYQYLCLDEEPLSNVSSRRRYVIKREVRQAQEELTINCECDEARLEEWYSIYAERFAEIGAAPVPKAFFENARRILFPAGNGKFWFAFHEGRLIGGTLLVHNRHVMDYLSTAFCTRDRGYNPGNLIIAEALRWARQQTIRYFNWKSAPSRDSGVYRYKARWGSEESSHYFLTRITGDIGRLRKVGLATVKQAYLGHYVMPYEALAEDC